MNGVDRMTLTVLPDGTAKLEVDGISGANHATAEMLVDAFSKLMGGTTNVTKRPETHSHGMHRHTHSH